MKYYPCGKVGRAGNFFIKSAAVILIFSFAFPSGMLLAAEEGVGMPEQPAAPQQIPQGSSPEDVQPAGNPVKIDFPHFGGVESGAIVSPTDHAPANPPSNTGGDALSNKQGERGPKTQDRRLEKEKPVVLKGSEPEAPLPIFDTKRFSPNIDNLTGALTYRYDIVLPPGRDNLTPNFSLVYNSALDNNDSVVGYGWSFTIPSIERINRKGIEGFYGENYFSSTLSGELVSTGTSTFAAKTETGDFLSYERIGDGWLVTNKEGMTYTFGSTTQARQDDPDNASRVYKWMLEEVRDANDNFIDYQYYKEDGQIYPSTITYTGHGTTTGMYEIDFNRTPSSWTVRSNYAGFQMDTSDLIEEIVIKAAGDNVRVYDLSYGVGHNKHRSLLKGIAESGVDEFDATTTLPSTIFGYQSAGDEWEFDQSKFQIPSAYDTGNSDYFFPALGSGTQLMDVNGDGLLDFINTIPGFLSATNTISSGVDNQPRVYLNTGSGWEFNSNLYQVPSIYQTGSSQYLFLALTSGALLIDVNGDGLPDFVNTSEYYYSSSSIPTNIDDTPHVYLNTGSGWEFNANSYQLPSNYNSSGGNYHFIPINNSSNQIADVNGDGLPDFLYSDPDPYYDADGIIPNNTNNAPRVYLNTGNGWQFDPDLYQMPSDYDTSHGQYYFPDLGPETQLIDVNGDGLLDVVHTIDGSYYQASSTVPDNIDNKPRVYLNTSTGWQFDQDFYQIPSMYVSGSNNYYFPTLSLLVRLLDVNGDSLPDYVYSGEGRSDTSTTTSESEILPRVYLNTGHSWQFDQDFFQLPSSYDSIEENYYFPGLDEDTQLIDVNGDNLLDFVHTIDAFHSDSPNISDNVNNKPRVHVNSGYSWQFDSGSYQIPSAYATEDRDYFFPALGDAVQLIDINDDGMLDFVNTVSAFHYASSTIPNGDENMPRVYLNTGDKADRLSAITAPSMGTTTITYQQKAVIDRNPFRQNQDFYVVKDITTNDGLGNFATTSYQHEDGKYYFHDEQYRSFTGFAKVTSTDPEGNVTKKYFHQGNSSQETLGEYSDHVSKVGMPYRVEEYDNAGNLFRLMVEKWDKHNIGPRHDFAKMVRKTVLTFDGDTDHKDTSTEYVYDNTNGNLSEVTEWGQVTATSSDGSFTDTGSDKFTTSMTYATSSATSSLHVFLPSQQKTLDQSGTIIRDSKLYYDSLSYGSVNIGNVTKEERLKSGGSYVDIEKTYNDYGLVTQEKDPRDKTTTYSYDAFNLYPATTTNPLGHTTNAMYDYSLGKPKQITDQNGNISQIVYDGLDRVVEERQPATSTAATTTTKTTYVYSDNVFPTSVLKTDYLNESLLVPTYTYFDGFKRPIQERRRAEDSNTYAVTDTIYNNRGLKQKESLSYFSTGSARTSPTATAALYNNFSYDALGRVTAIANAVGTTTNAYDDWKLTVTNVLGKTKDLYKDARGNLVQVDEHNNANTYSTYYEWNGLGNLTKITDAAGNVRNFTYDALGRRTAAQDLHVSTDATFGSTTATYDDAGNVTTSVDARGETVNYTYDDINRPLTENFTGWAGTEVSYGYDSCGNGVGHLCTATSSATTTVISSYSYDSLGRTTSESRTIGGTAFATTYVYDRLGNPTLITYPDASEVSYAYNAGGLTETIARKESGGSFTNVVDDLDYSPEGKITYQLDHNGVFTQNTYDANALYRLTNKYTETPLGGIDPSIQNITYTYDDVGNITALDDSTKTINAKNILYAYDDLSRLTSASTTYVGIGSGYKELYTYDAIGNITTKGNSITTYSYTGTTTGSYANPHAVTLLRTTTYGYDKDGNLLTIGGTATSTYDYHSRLVTHNKSATTTSYSYDHDGARTTYTANGTTTIYPNQYWNTTGGATTSHIFLGSTMIATVTGTSTIHYHHLDHLSGANISTDSTGLVSEYTDYQPFGAQRINQSYDAFKEQRKFTGHEYDGDTAFTYMNARYYDGSIGKFRSQDPVFVNLPTGEGLVRLLSNPQELNSYSYVANNPLRYVDPTGKTRTEAVRGSIGATLDFIENSVTGLVMAAFHPIQTAENLPNIPSSIAGQLKDIKAEIASGDDTRGGYALTLGLFLIGSVINPEMRVRASFNMSSVPRFVTNATVDDYGTLIRGTVDLKPTLDRINSGKLLEGFRNDGVEFRNDISQGGNRLLPERPAGYYTEYVHPTPGIVDRQGPQRVIVGARGEVFYSPDHYNSAIRLNPLRK